MFLVITRYHGLGGVPGWVEMLPTSLPELPKPSRTSGESRKREFLNPKLSITIRENSLTFLIHPFKGPY